MDIRFSRTLNSCKLPQIRYASPERLFERLTDLRFLSIDFLNTFLLTYRVFTDSITVIEALKRVHYNPDLQMNGMSSSLHDSSGSLEEGEQRASSKVSGDSAGGGQHLHPNASPHHAATGTALLNIHTTQNPATVPPGTASTGAVGAANDYLTTTIEYDYTRRVSTSSVLSDINELGQNRESAGTETSTSQQLIQSQFNASSFVIRNSQHWRLSYRKCKLIF